MITIDEMQEMLEEIAEEVPQPFYEELNGGILLLPDTVLSPESLNEDLYTLGQYVFSPSMGRYIAIYHGSFNALFPHYSHDQIYVELKEILFHEFTHHVEALAGERGLDIKDQQDLHEYLRDSGMYASPGIKNVNLRKKKKQGR